MNRPMFPTLAVMPQSSPAQLAFQPIYKRVDPFDSDRDSSYDYYFPAGVEMWKYFLRDRSLCSKADIVDLSASPM